MDEFTISQASDIITTVAKSIKTNMPVKDMIWFYINVAREIDFVASRGGKKTYIQSAYALDTDEKAATENKPWKRRRKGAKR